MTFPSFHECTIRVGTWNLIVLPSKSILSHILGSSFIMNLYVMRQLSVANIEVCLSCNQVLLSSNQVRIIYSERTIPKICNYLILSSGTVVLILCKDNLWNPVVDIPGLWRYKQLLVLKYCPKRIFHREGRVCKHFATCEQVLKVRA